MLSAAQLAILDAAFEGKLPPLERRTLEALSPDEARIVVERLSAILELDRRIVSPEEVARSAALSRSRLYALRAEWRRLRSLTPLIPYSSRKPDLDADWPPLFDSVDARRRSAAKTATRLVSSTPDYVSVGEIATELIERERGGVSYRTALAYVRRARLEAALSPTRLRKAYGRGIAVDLCAVDVIVDDGGMVGPAVSGLVVETSTSLIIGSSTASRAGIGAVQRQAVRDAIAMLRLDRLDVAGADIDITWIVAPLRSPTTIAAAGPLGPALPGLSAVAEGERRFGSEIVRLVGTRLGDVGLLPRSTAADRRSATGGMDAVPPYVAASRVALAVERHNHGILRALRSVAAPPLPLLSEGAMGAALAGLEGALAPT